MRNVFLFLSLTTALAAAPALAQQEKQLGMPVQMLDKTPAQRLDELFTQLKKTGNARAAEQVANRIGSRWSESGSASVDLIIGWAKQAADAKKFDVALDFLDQATTLKPDYAEAYFRRATVHLLMGNREKAMADINTTLRLEPRHYGALAEMAQLMKARGFKQSALALYERVLEVYPMLRDAQGEVSTLSEELEPRAI